jgi:hypothetical protein
VKRKLRQKSECCAEIGAPSAHRDGTVCGHVVSSFFKLVLFSFNSGKQVRLPFLFVADEHVILLVTNHIRTKSPGLPDSRIVPGVVTPATVKL